MSIFTMQNTLLLTRRMHTVVDASAPKTFKARLNGTLCNPIYLKVSRFIAGGSELDKL